MGEIQGKLNDRQRLFAKGVVMGKPASVAYQDAGYNVNDDVARPAASRLLSNVHVKAEIKRLRELSDNESVVTREKLKQELWNITTAEGDYRGSEVRTSDRVASSREIKKMEGWDAPEQVEVNVAPLEQLMDNLRKRRNQGPVIDAEVEEVEDPKRLENSEE